MDVSVAKDGTEEGDVLERFAIDVLDFGVVVECCLKVRGSGPTRSGGGNFRMDRYAHFECMHLRMAPMFRF